MILQPDLNEKMRDILFGWMIDVHNKFKLDRKTLFRTFFMIDQWSQTHTFPRTQYQLVGVTSMWIAAKIDEIYAPEIRDIVYICDKAYTKAQVLDMETKMVWSIDHVAPTVWDFAEMMETVCALTKHQMDQIYKVLMCVVCCYPIFVAHKASLLAAASIALIVPDLAWSRTTLYYFGHPKKTIMETVENIKKTVLLPRCEFNKVESIQHLFPLPKK